MDLLGIRAIVFILLIWNPMFPPPKPPFPPKPVSVLMGGFKPLPITGSISVGNEIIPARPNEATLYESALHLGTVGVLAHNSLAGQTFATLKPRSSFSLLNENGQRVPYAVSEIKRYQALTPTSPYSSFLDLDTGKKYTSQELTTIMYKSGNPAVLQTCIEKDGDLNWGRLFIVAKPLEIRKEYQIE